jgi:hypothetical protein
MYRGRWGYVTALLENFLPGGGSDIDAVSVLADLLESKR